MLKIIDFLKLTAAKSIKSSDTSIMVTAASATRLNQMAIGDFTYFNLKQGGNHEIVKYTHLANHTASSGSVALAVERNANGEGAKNFATPLCFGSEVTGFLINAMFSDATC